MALRSRDRSQETKKQSRPHQVGFCFMAMDLSVFETSIFNDPPMQNRQLPTVVMYARDWYSDTVRYSA